MAKNKGREENITLWGTFSRANGLMIQSMGGESE